MHDAIGLTLGVQHDVHEFWEKFVTFWGTAQFWQDRLPWEDFVLFANIFLWVRLRSISGPDLGRSTRRDQRFVLAPRDSGR